jgi:hypothetical protein
VVTRHDGQQRHPDVHLALDEAAVERPQEADDLPLDERDLRLGTVHWIRRRVGIDLHAQHSRAKPIGVPQKNA